MHPGDTDPQPSFELPKPQVEAGSSDAASKPEKAPAAAEKPLSSPPPAPAPAVNPVLGVLPVAPKSVSSPTAATPSATSGNPAIADDNDIIEKEWVDKAKAIVARTRTDLHEQNKEMTKFKADYLKKRYNKELKVSEDS